MWSQEEREAHWAGKLGLAREAPLPHTRSIPITPGIPELVAALQARGTAVFLVSGGFRQVIHPIAASLGIPLERVYANKILFSVSGCSWAPNW